MRALGSKYSTFFWITLIVFAELASFWLLQKSVDSSKNALFYVLCSILLFGIVVPLSFRETLKGTKLAVSNLYWIIASEIGSVALGLIVFKQSLTVNDYAAVALLSLAAVVQVFQS
jgi:hypothetical protein